MDICFDKQQENIEVGDWVKIYDKDYRIVISSYNETQYALLNPRSGSITTQWFGSIYALLDGMGVTKMVKKDDIKVSCI